MPLMNLVVVLIVVGMALWLVNRYIPMASSIKTILNVVVVVAVWSLCFEVRGTLGRRYQLPNRALTVPRL